jgi:hypothetical protein
MKLFQAILVAVLVFAILLKISASRGSQKKWFNSDWLSGLVAAVVGLVVSFMTNIEAGSTIDLSKAISQQLIAVQENSPYPYQQGLVIVPSLIPLPALAGKLVAVAPLGAKIQTEWVANVLHVSAVDLQGKAVDLQCVAPPEGTARLVFASGNNNRCSI